MERNKIIRKEVNFSIVGCRIATNFGQDKSSLHWHEKCEICHMIEGSSGAFIDGKKVEVKEGDLIFVDSCLPHYYYSLNGEPTTVRFCLFLPKVLFKLSKDYQPIKIHITREELKQIPGMEATLKSLFEILDAEARIEAEDPFVISVVSSIYYLLVRHFGTKRDNNIHLNKERQDFYRVMEYINEHMTEHITTVSLSDILMIPRGRLAEIFSKYAGMNISDYLNSLRIQYANDLMSNGKNMTEAALESGFQSIRTFNYIYKKQTGVTPTEFLKSKKESSTEEI